MGRKHNIQFTQCNYRYWELIWIGQILYQNNQFKVEFFFMGKDLISEKISSPKQAQIEKKIVPISYLAEYTIGSIYDHTKKLQLQVISDNIIATASKKIYLSKKPFPLTSYIGINNTNFDNLSYLVLYAKKNRKAFHVLISPYIILNHFLGKSDKLIRLAIRGQLYEYFTLSKTSFYNDTETNEKIAKIEYDSSKLSKSDAESIVPLFFLKEEVGLSFLKSLGSQTLSSIINSKNNIVPCAYPSFKWEFSNYKLRLLGQEIPDTKITIQKGGEKEEIVERSYFIAHKIDQIRFLDPEPYIVDRIILIAKKPKESTEDRKNHSPIDVKRESAPKTESLSLQISQDTTNNTPPIKTKSKTDIISPLGLKIEFEKRKNQINSYNVTLIPNNNEFENIVRDLNNFSNTSKNLRENINIQIRKITELSNFKYFEGVIDSLIKEYKLEIKQNLFSSNNNTPSINSQTFKIAEVHYKNTFIYLIEFETGLIGIFYNISKFKISSEKLRVIIIDFFEKGKEIKEQKKRKLLWTFIESKSYSYQKEFQINIVKGIKHIRKLNTGTQNINEIKNTELFYRATAKKIIRDRIKKIP